MRGSVARCRATAEGRVRAEEAPVSGQDEAVVPQNQISIMQPDPEGQAPAVQGMTVHAE